MKLSATTLARIAVRGLVRVARMVRRGELDAVSGDNIASGVRAYVEAVRSGNIATQDAYDARLAVCRLCDSYTLMAGDADNKHTPGFCGTPGVCRMGQSTPTCGCMVSAKAAVGPATCPQLRWPTIKGGAA
jgi:hypothetical protein